MAAEVAGGAAVAEVAAAAAGVAAAAGSVASGSVPAWAARVALVRVAADRGERAACAESNEKL